jgi:hypothetical protein
MSGSDAATAKLQQKRREKRQREAMRAEATEEELFVFLYYSLVTQLSLAQNQVRPPVISHQPSAISHQPSSISPLPRIRCDHQPSAISHQPSAISHQSFAQNQVRSSAISHQPSAISHQPSAISHQPSAICHQSFAQNQVRPSAISHQPSAISHQSFAHNQVRSSVTTREGASVPSTVLMRIPNSAGSQHVGIPRRQGHNLKGKSGSNLASQLREWDEGNMAVRSSCIRIEIVAEDGKLQDLFFPRPDKVRNCAGRRVWRSCDQVVRWSGDQVVRYPGHRVNRVIVSSCHRVIV